MRRLHFAAFLALTALQPPAWTALAQESNQGVVTDRDNPPTCRAAGGGSRVRPNCDSETTTAAFRTEQELQIQIEVPPLPSAQCSASSTTQYEQRNTLARINSTVQVSDCTAASGTFTVAIRTRDESGADKPLEFSETWQRSEGKDAQFTADYPIGENSELVSVRLRGLTCTCADGAESAGEQAAGPGTLQGPPDAVLPNAVP